MAELIAQQSSTGVVEDDFADFVETHDPYDPIDQERVEVLGDEAEKRKTQDAGAFLERRRVAYIRVFGGGATAEDLQLVHDDLNKFCFGDTTVFHQDERVHCLLTGRQEVIRRIQDHTGLSLDALLLKYTRPAT